jgi:hypothetical protein
MCTKHFTWRTSKVNAHHKHAIVTASIKAKYTNSFRALPSLVKPNFHFDGVDGERRLSTFVT